jgi:hypothetical protein
MSAVGTASRSSDTKPTKPTVSEWVPPDLSGYDLMKWERLTEEQKKLVKRMYETFRNVAEELERMVLNEEWLSAYGERFSRSIGARCGLYFGPVDELEEIDKIEKSYSVDDLETRISAIIRRESTVIGLTCYIGEDKEGKDTFAYVEMPVDMVSYSIFVYGKHPRFGEFYWIARFRSTEPTVSFS